MPRLPQAVNYGVRLAVAGAALAGWSGANTLAPSPAVATVVTPRFEFLFLVPQERSAKLLMNPLGLAFDAKRGLLYVADTSHSRIAVFNKNGVFLSSFKHWVKYYTGERILGEPWRVLPWDRGTLLVSDRLGDRVDIVDMMGTTVDSLDITALMGTKERATPGAMGRDAAGKLYLLEHTSGQVLIIDAARRRLLRAFGPKGEVESRFRSIVDIAVAPDGTVYALDSIDDDVVQVFDAAGKLLRGFGRHGDKAKDFHHPAAITLDEAGRLWIVDSFSHEVKVFSTAGEFLTAVGQMGAGRGDLYFPADAAVTPDTLYVLERAGERLQAFRIVGP